jgi:hypothetical protein
LVFYLLAQAFVQLAQLRYLLVVDTHQPLLLGSLPLHHTLVLFYVLLKRLYFFFEGVHAAQLKLQIEFAVNLLVILRGGNVFLDELNDLVPLLHEILHLFAFPKHLEEALEEGQKLILFV